MGIMGNFTYGVRAPGSATKALPPSLFAPARVRGRILWRPDTGRKFLDVMGHVGGEMRARPGGVETICNEGRRYISSRVLLTWARSPIARKMLDIRTILRQPPHLDDLRPDRHAQRLFLEALGIDAAAARPDVQVRTRAPQQQKPLPLPHLVVAALPAAVAERLPFRRARGRQILVHPSLNFIDATLFFRFVHRDDFRALPLPAPGGARSLPEAAGVRPSFSWRASASSGGRSEPSDSL